MELQINPNIVIEQDDVPRIERLLKENSDLLHDSPLVKDMKTTIMIDSHRHIPPRVYNVAPFRDHLISGGSLEITPHPSLGDLRAIITAKNYEALEEFLYSPHLHQNRIINLTNLSRDDKNKIIRLDDTIIDLSDSVSYENLEDVNGVIHVDLAEAVRFPKLRRVWSFHARIANTLELPEIKHVTDYLVARNVKEPRFPKLNERFISLPSKKDSSAVEVYFSRPLG